VFTLSFMSQTAIIHVKMRVIFINKIARQDIIIRAAQFKVFSLSFANEGQFHCDRFLPCAPACIVEHHVSRPSVTLNFSLSFEARELKFCIQTPHFTSKKVIKVIFEIGTIELWDFFLG